MVLFVLVLMLMLMLVLRCRCIASRTVCVSVNGRACGSVSVSGCVSVRLSVSGSCSVCVSVWDSGIVSGLGLVVEFGFAGGCRRVLVLPLM